MSERREGRAINIDSRTQSCGFDAQKDKGGMTHHENEMLGKVEVGHVSCCRGFSLLVLETGTGHQLCGGMLIMGHVAILLPIPVFIRLSNTR